MNVEQPVYVKILNSKGKVVLLFSEDMDFSKPTPIDQWIIDPAECIDICESMVSNAFEARDDVKPVGDALKAELVERHRMKLTKRISLVLNSKRENKKLSNGKLSQEIVEIMLREVF